MIDRDFSALSLLRDFRRGRKSSARTHSHEQAQASKPKEKDGEKNVITTAESRLASLYVFFLYIARSTRYRAAA